VSDSIRRSLRSADVPPCMVQRTHSNYGDRTYAAAGPRLWNSLPVQLRNPDITYGLFRWQLKAHLFREAWTRRSVTSDMQRVGKNTYLLTYYSEVCSYNNIEPGTCDNSVFTGYRQILACLWWRTLLVVPSIIPRFYLDLKTDSTLCFNKSSPPFIFVITFPTVKKSNTILAET